MFHVLWGIDFNKTIKKNHLITGPKFGGAGGLRRGSAKSPCLTFFLKPSLIPLARWTCCIIIDIISTKGYDGFKAENKQRPTTIWRWGHMTMLIACAAAQVQNFDLNVL